MKKLLIGTVTITACVALCAAVWSQPPQSHSADPYRTDIYPDTVWVDGRAHYNVPGFGLIEWSGPSTVVVDYTMYASGNKVGIMD